MESEPAERGGRSLAAGDNKRPRVDMYLLMVHALPVLVVAEDVRHEVLACVRAEGEPLVRLLARQVVRLDLLLDVLLVDHEEEQRAQDGVLREEVELGAGLDGLEQHRDPGVVVALLEGVEGVAEGQIADDVEGEVVEPARHVEDVARARLLAEAGDEQVDVVLD